MIVFTLDSTYHKIYGINMKGSMGAMKSSIESWMEKQQGDYCFSMAKAWCSYWELTDAEVTNMYSSGNVSTTEAGYGAGNDFEIFFPDGSSFYVLNRFENPQLYGKEGDGVLLTGMGTFLTVM